MDLKMRSYCSKVLLLYAYKRQIYGHDARFHERIRSQHRLVQLISC